MTRLDSLFDLPTSTSLLINEHSGQLITDDMVGIEVELEGLHVNNDDLRAEVDRRWNIIEDGSLRNEGREFVFERPMFGTDVVECLMNLPDAFNALGISPTISNRCSVHVHIDVRDLQYEQLLTFVATYLLCEPYFFAVGGEERKDNIYSRPLAGSEDYLNRLGRAFKMRDDESMSWVFRNNINNHVKYSAFNVAPIQSQGSIEFRHHRGTYNPEVLINWTNMVLAIKRYTMSLGSQRMTSEFIDSIVNGGYEEFVRTVFEGVSIPSVADGWDSAARIAKRVTSIAIGEVDDKPMFPWDGINNRFTKAQKKIGSSVIKPKSFHEHMKVLYGEGTVVMRDELIEGSEEPTSTLVGSTSPTARSITARSIPSSWFDIPRTGGPSIAADTLSMHREVLNRVRDRANTRPRGE